MKLLNTVNSYKKTKVSCKSCMKCVQSLENFLFQIFIANNDQNTEVKHWLLQSITTNHLRIQPIEWNVAICLRFELYGCSQSTFSKLD